MSVRIEDLEARKKLAEDLLMALSSDPRLEAEAHHAKNSISGVCNFARSAYDATAVAQEIETYAMRLVSDVGW